MKTRSLHIILIVLISGFLGYYLGVSKITFDWKNYKPHLSVISREPPASLSNVDFSTFWTVWQKIEDSYYDKKALDPQKLVNGAISGMVQSLGDPYTVYLPPVQNDNFKQGLAGQKFEGIGAELGMKDKQIIVVAPLDGMPAKKAGIRSGDAILKVDNQPTTGWTLAQAVDKIRGPKGTTVTLTILHKGASDPTDIKIERDSIVVKSVEGFLKEADKIDGIKVSNSKKQVLYIRVSQFGDNTNQEWLAVVNKLSLEMNGKKDIAGLVLDLRNNPGGYLTDATFIASEFLRSGPVVMEEKANGDRTTFSVTRQGVFTDLPVVVLVNKGSASASEIVAGALRDQRKIKLIGETSFGKGTIQQAEDLGGGAGLHVTIAKWLTPNGTWVNGKGLEPDIAVAADEKDQSHDLQLEKAVGELIK
ncbi:MAG: S41 family peptidase [Candidatus Levybacteria bacterium]|nr:S41 family peptidase [Candidatus Levybacteria bacterium]